MLKMPDRNNDMTTKNPVGETDLSSILRYEELPPKQAAERDSEESFKRRRDALKEAFEALK